MTLYVTEEYVGIGGEVLSSKPLLLTLINFPGVSCNSLRCE